LLIPGKFIIKCSIDDANEAVEYTPNARGDFFDSLPSDFKEKVLADEEARMMSVVQ